jgi:hypothetical protein
MAKFSAKKPKGDAWGIDDVIAEMTEKVLDGEHSPVVPIIGMIRVSKVTTDSATGEHEATVEIGRIESITSIERIRSAQKMLLEQVAARRGEGTMLPFDEQELINRAFGIDANGTAATVGQQLQDDEETNIDAEIDDDGRLRRHLIAVHAYDPNVVFDEETSTADVERSHDEEHAKDPADRTWPDHDPESRMWRRVDLTDLIGDSEEPTETDQPLTLYEVDGAITDDPAAALIPEFESPGEAVDAESLNPQFGEPWTGENTPPDDKPEGE